MKLAVLASGRGSNFCAIAKACQEARIPKSSVTALIANNPHALALEHAKAFGVPTAVVESSGFIVNGKLDRTAFEKELLLAIQKAKPDYICLAGYMLLLGKNIIAEYPNRIVNIHPSLLPAFPGLFAQKQAVESGVKWSGCTVHFVTEKLDDGPILAQEAVEIQHTDTPESFAERLLPVEHKTYVRALRLLATTPFEIAGNRVIWKT